MLAFLSRFEARLFAHVERVIHSRFDRMEDIMSAQSDAFAKALSDLSTRFTEKLGEMDSQIEAAKAAQVAQDDAAFKDATDKLTAMTASLGEHADAMHQTATAALGDATGTAPIVADTPVVPVPVSETATTDPTGTAAGAGGVANNIPDGAHNTGAPADANDPLTGKPAAIVGEDPRTL